jgi:hypothetical protein
MVVNSVSFGQRPYGYDPKKGRVTPEQCKRDFKPGIYDPADREKRNEIRKKAKIAATIAGLSTAAVLGFVFRKPIGKALNKGLDVVKPFIQEGLTKGKELVAKGAELVKPTITKATKAVKDLGSKISKYIKPLLTKGQETATVIYSSIKNSMRSIVARFSK